MNILVILKMVPDVVEELEVSADGKSLDMEFLRMIVSERDDHALEEGLLLKERYGGTVTVVAYDAPEVDDVLFTALAKGVDRAVKLSNGEGVLSTRSMAKSLAGVLATVPGLLPADLILTGVQAIDDLDGHLAPSLSHLMQLPYVGIVTQVVVDEAGGQAAVVKEYSGGIRGEFEVGMPAILGIQAAEKPPRYVPVAKVRAAMKSQSIESLVSTPKDTLAAAEVLQMAKPEVASHAEMLVGSPEEVAGKICAILSDRGLA